MTIITSHKSSLKKKKDMSRFCQNPGSASNHVTERDEMKIYMNDLTKVAMEAVCA